LHLTVDAKNPERLHQQVEKQKENDILDETVLHHDNIVRRAKVGKKTLWRSFSVSNLEIICIFTTELRFLK
jgi:hypothetical protein